MLIFVLSAGVAAQTDEPQGPPEPEISEEARNGDNVCDEMVPDAVTVLERARKTLTTGACRSAAWLDGLFGDRLYYDDYRDTYGSVSAGALWTDYDGLDPRVRFRVRMKLPQMDERLSAFIGRVGQDEYVSDSESEFVALPTRQFGGRLEEETLLVGLGYSEAERTGNDFDVDVGVRVRLPLDPYARSSYEIIRTFAEQYVVRARQTVFWQNSEGFGTTSRLILDRALSERFLVRWGGLAKYTQETEGVEWYTESTLFQAFSARTALAWQLHVGGQLDNEVPLTDYGARLILRRRLDPEWLILELRAGVHFPRYLLEEERKLSPEAGIALEMQFVPKR